MDQGLITRWISLTSGALKAAAVQLGTVNFVYPDRWIAVLEGITDYLRRHRIGSLSSLVGSLRGPDIE